MNHIIKPLTLLLLAALLLFTPEGASAQKRLYPEFHYLALPISFGYSSYLSPKFQNEISTFKVPGKVGATVGIGYEYRYRTFWMSLGLEGQVLTSRLRPGITQMDTIMLDTDGYFTDIEERKNRYTYHISDWHDDQLGVYGCFPVMFGFRINAFYMGVGAKFGYCFYASSTPSMEYTTTAQYGRYYEDFHDMPNHYLTGYSAAVANPEDTKFSFNFNVAAIAEIGYEVYHFEGSKQVLPWLLKLGAYAEYGFFSAYDNGGNIKPDITYKTVTVTDPVSGATAEVSDPSQLCLTPFYRAHDTRGVSINPLYVGVKATFMFELPVPQKCHCLQKERGASWRNMAPKQTSNQNKKAKKSVKKQHKKQTEADGNSNLSPQNAIE